MNLRFELLHPNNALKFRMQGEYKVEGAEQLARKIAAHNEHWSILLFLIASCVWDKLLEYVVRPLMELPPEGLQAGMLPGLAAWTALCAGLAAVLHRNQRLVMLSTYSLTVPLFGIKARTMSTGRSGPTTRRATCRSRRTEGRRQALGLIPRAGWSIVPAG